MRKRILGVIAAVSMGCASLSAAQGQQAGAPATAAGRGRTDGTVAGPISPEVRADGKVTFRLRAPNAAKVQVQGDFTLHSSDLLDMTKDSNGIWSCTTAALKPSSYQYWYIMDGLTMPDPVNTYVRPASGVYKSQFDVPGAEMAWMAFRDVPHGVLHEHWYLNKSNETARRVVIYTPPGYDAGTKSYPVLYLLHGANDFERGWTQTGRAHWIMDNLLAEGKAQPAIIVMPFGHEVTGASGQQAGIHALQAELGEATGQGGRGGAAAGGVSYMENDLLNNVMPLVEKEYRVIKDANHRAIFGYSMGAGHSSTIGMNHPELFAYIGVFSGGAREAAIAKPLAEPERTNKAFKLIWVGCGGDDTTALVGTRAFEKLLTDKGIKHEWTESPGYHHDYQIWRIYLRDLLPRLFKD